MKLIERRVHTETTRAEVARANPAILVASTHFWAKSLRSAWREHEILAPAGSKPKAFEMDWGDFSCKVLVLPNLVGCMKVAAACSEAAIATNVVFPPHTLSLRSWNKQFVSVFREWREYNYLVAMVWVG